MLYNYFIVALRNIRRHASYTTINVLGLGVSIASVVVIFAMVRTHLSYDNFHADSDRIYRIVTEQHRDHVSYTQAVPAPLGKAFREDHTFAEKVGRMVFAEVLVTVDEGNKKFKESRAAFAENDYFDIFNFPLKEGSLISLRDPNTAIISEKLAKKYFGESDAIGKTFRVNNKIDIKIVGILEPIPENTEQTPELYISYPTLKAYDEWIASDDSWGGISGDMRCYVKLKPGVSVADVEAVFPEYVKKHRPKSKNVHHYKLQPLNDIHFNAQYGGPMEKKNLWVLSLIGFLLMATACVNFVNLATAQATSRSKEVGVRKVLGGMRSQLFRQFMTETGVITLAATLLGLLLAYTFTPYVNELFATEVHVGIFNDRMLFVFLPVVVIIVTLFAGVYPGLILSGFQPIQSLKGKLSDMKIGGLNVRRSLIVSQLAIAEVLIIGLLVIVYQLRYAKESDMGFDKDAIVMLRLGSSDNKMISLKDELATVPGVEKVSLCFAPPASDDGWNTNLRYDNGQEDEAFLVSCKIADDQFLSTFGLQLVAGRNLTPSDTVKEFLVNETFAAKLNVAPEELVGKMIGVNGNHFRGPVVGVIKDFHSGSYHEDIQPIFVTTNNEMYNAYAVKVNATNINSTLKALESKWVATYPEQIYEYQFLDQQIAGFYKTEDTMMKIIQVFCGIAILIGSMGLYGLVAFMANQKNKEIGIRKVLGSSTPQILWIFGKEFSVLIVFSFILAAPAGGYLMNQWLQNFKFRITLGPSIFVAALSATALVCLCTVFVQSFRAARRNPVDSLRSE